MPLNPIYPTPPTTLLVTRYVMTGLGGVIYQFAARVCVPSVRRCLYQRRYERGGSFFYRGVEQLAARQAQLCPFRYNPKVAGSSPVPAIIFVRAFLMLATSLSRLSPRRDFFLLS